MKSSSYEFLIVAAVGILSTLSAKAESKIPFLVARINFSEGTPPGASVGNAWKTLADVETDLSGKRLNADVGSTVIEAVVIGEKNKAEHTTSIRLNFQPMSMADSSHSMERSKTPQWRDFYLPLGGGSQRLVLRSKGSTFFDESYSEIVAEALSQMIESGNGFGVPALAAFAKQNSLSKVGTQKFLLGASETFKSCKSSRDEPGTCLHEKNLIQLVLLKH